MAADLIIYAVIAAGLVFWLRGILGTRHGEERDRPTLFTDERKTDAPDIHAQSIPMTPEEKLSALTDNRVGITGIENKTAEHGLLDILRMDKTFNIEFFLQAAQDTFVMVVEAFSAGDRETLRDLLAPNVYMIFEASLDAREQAGEIQSTEIQAIRRAEIIEARLEGRNAFITMRFKAEEISWTKNREGEIIAGHETRQGEMRDIWTFSRDLRGKDPRWLVSETRGGFEDDNDLIPNS